MEDDDKPHPSSLYAQAFTGEKQKQQLGRGGVVRRWICVSAERVARRGRPLLDRVKWSMDAHTHYVVS